MGASSKELSNTMGSDTPQANGKSEKENNRDLIVAQALGDYADSGRIRQSNHETCLLDSKIAQESRLSPHSSAEMLTRAMTSTNGEVTMLDNTTKVKLDSSWMKPDNEARNSGDGDHAREGMSGDVRMLTGLYANALTQNRPDGSKQMFTMSRDGVGAVDSADSGDRLVDMKHRAHANDGQERTRCG